MDFGEIIDMITLVIKNADFMQVLSVFKQLVPFLEKIFSVFAGLFGG